MPETDLTKRLQELEENEIFHEQLYDIEGAEYLRLVTKKAVSLLKDVYSELRGTEEPIISPPDLKKESAEVARRAYAKALLGVSDSPKRDAWEEWKIWLSSQGVSSSDCEEYTDDRDWMNILDNPESKQFIEVFFLIRRLRLSLDQGMSMMSQLQGDYYRLTKHLMDKIEAV